MAANAVLNNRKGKTLVVQDLQLAYQLLHKRDYRNEQSVHWKKLEYSGPCLLDRQMTLNFYGPQTTTQDVALLEKNDSNIYKYTRFYNFIYI